MRLTVSRSTPIQRTARVMQVEGMFDVAPAEISGVRYDVELPIEDFDWNLGLIVGSSGSGKTTIAREAFGSAFGSQYEWPAGKAVVDCFPREMGVKQVVDILNRVGFSSPPNWLRPYSVLSNGERFRVDLARTIAEAPEIAVVDEFTSVVDRQVAKMGSLAVAKAVRKLGRKLVAISCHYDIIEWLQPDWIYSTDQQRFERREPGSHPAFFLDLYRTTADAWRVFAPHHYLSRELNKASRCLVGVIEDRPAVFCAILPFPSATIRHAFRIHRIVTHPDYQGAGVGMKVLETVAQLNRALGRRLFITSTHPALVASLLRNAAWRTVRAPSLRKTRPGNTKALVAKTMDMTPRMTATFEYAGPKGDTQLAMNLLVR